MVEQDHLVEFFFESPLTSARLGVVVAVVVQVASLAHRHQVVERRVFGDVIQVGDGEDHLRAGAVRAVAVPVDAAAVR